LETVLSITTLAGLIWIVRFLLPRAAREDDRFALLCASLTLLLALIVWFLLGATRVF
jgi:hypothetical protein